jgi:hypothetical protein
MFSLHLYGELAAGQDRLPIDEDGARTAFAMVTAPFGPGQSDFRP